MKKNCLVADFMQLLADELKKNGQERTARAYRSTLKRLCGFAGPELTFQQITPALMEKFQQLLVKEGCAKNTISFYMRNLRAGYNKAVKLKLFKPCANNPFENVYTGTDKTLKRALSKKDISKLVEPPLQTSPRGGLNKIQDTETQRINENLCVSIRLKFFNNRSP